MGSGDFTNAILSAGTFPVLHLQVVDSGPFPGQRQRGPTWRRRVIVVRQRQVNDGVILRVWRVRPRNGRARRRTVAHQLALDLPIIL